MISPDISRNDLDLSPWLLQQGARRDKCRRRLQPSRAAGGLKDAPTEPRLPELLNSRVKRPEPKPLKPYKPPNGSSYFPVWFRARPIGTLRLKFQADAGAGLDAAAGQAGTDGDVDVPFGVMLKRNRHRVLSPGVTEPQADAGLAGIQGVLGFGDTILNSNELSMVSPDF